MRYTTVIDISEMPEVYRSVSVRLVYFHLTLKAGYHDNDRDRAALSIRRLAMDAGVTVSAARHAIRQLEKSGLLKRDGKVLVVKKWIEEQKSTTRARTKREMQEQIHILERQKNQAVLERLSQEKESYDPKEAEKSEGFQNIMRRFKKPEIK